MKIFEAIRKDHDIQRKLIEELVKTSGDTEKRKRIYYQLKYELKIHADAEEKYFYIPLIKDNLSQDDARHGVAEHHEIDELVEQLEDTEFDSSAWLTTAKKLNEKVLHHLEEEEHKFFQIAGKVLNEKEKLSLANQYLAEIDNNRILELK